MRTTTEIAKLAGLLEGEGCFSMRKSKTSVCPSITVVSTDKDVIEWVKTTMGARPKIHHQVSNLRNHKDAWRLEVKGVLAVCWMMTLFTLMHSRRKEKIKEILKSWKETTTTKWYRLKAERNYFGLRGNSTPICHPDEPYGGNGLCRRCYTRPYQEAYKKRIKAVQDAS